MILSLTSLTIQFTIPRSLLQGLFCPTLAEAKSTIATQNTELGVSETSCHTTSLSWYLPCMVTPMVLTSLAEIHKIEGQRIKNLISCPSQNNLPTYTCEKKKNFFQLKTENRTGEFYFSLCLIFLVPLTLAEVFDQLTSHTAVMKKSPSLPGSL